MHKKKFNNEATNILKRLPLILLIGGFASSNILMGCASVNRKEEAIAVILEKENILIEKLKAERAQPNIVAVIDTNEALKKAEIHLSTSLNEIQNANEKISKKIIKQKVKEIEDGKN